MKKSKEWKIHRLFLRRQRRSLERSRRRKLTRIDGFELSEFEKEIVVDVKAPDTFLLENEATHQRVCEFLATLRAAVKAQDKIVRINFKETRKVYAGAMLLLHAELSRLQEIYPFAKWACRPSADDVVNQVLKHLGIFARLGYESSVVPKRDDVVSWRHATSNLVDGEKSGGLLEMYKSLSRAETRHMFRGVAEATTNVVHHAYIESRNDGLVEYQGGRWWMFCREDNNQLYVSVCDLGIGIPRSLPARFGLETINKALQSFGGRSSDGAMIRAAIEIARTRTEKKGRGKGLGDLKRVVDEIEGARLYIFSNRGLVEYWGGAKRVRGFDRSILGTLIVWVLPTGVAEHGP